MNVACLDNIPEEVLDFIKKKYENNPLYRVLDHRKMEVFGKTREYFLFGRDDMFTFIWINNNLWQFSFINVNCSYKPAWKNPLDILNDLLLD